MPRLKVEPALTLAVLTLAAIVAPVSKLMLVTEYFSLHLLVALLS